MSIIIKAIAHIGLLFSLLNYFNYNLAVPHYYCTAADSKYYSHLLNLIGSIHTADYQDLAEIAVFDLGLTSEQRQDLHKMAKVKLRQVELVHPDLLKPFKTNRQGRMVRGWFAWKPVVIKQALDHFPYVLYIDAGALVLKPLDNLFKHIQQQGYFLMSCGPHTIADTLTRPLKTKLIPNLPNLTPEKQTQILAPDSFKISAGLQGLSRNHQAVYENYVLPMYRQAHNLELFADDGTAPGGFGVGRHDQPIFSIYAYLNNLTINAEGVSHLLVDGQDRQIHIHWNPACVSEKHTAIFQCRSQAGKYNQIFKQIRYKNS